MPKRFERHARGKSPWNGAGPRSGERQAAAADSDPSKRAPGRKDTRHFCKGKPGREHVPELVVRPQPFYTGVPGGECGWIPQWTPEDRFWDGARWSCKHEERCGNCGKILRLRLAPGECPAYPGSLEQRTDAMARAAVMQRQRDDWYSRPVITGPQGYRRRRAS